MEKSFLKWDNIDSSYLEKIIPLIHSFKKEGMKEQTFIEPFLGSGSVFLNIDKFENYILNDTDINIFMLFNQVKNGSDIFLQDLKEFFTESTNDKVFFKEAVKNYNSSNDYYKKCVLLLYLQRHSFNNLVRFNKLGNFNATFAKKQQSYYPQQEIKKMNEKLNKNIVQIFNYSFQRIFENLEYGDVVYCNPPQNYKNDDNDSFDLEKHKLLNHSAFESSLKGSNIIISNNYNEITKELYKDCSEYYIIKSKKNIAGKIFEKEKMIAIYA